MNRLCKYCLTLLLMLLSVVGRAEDIRFTASANKNVISDRDILIYTVTIEGVRDFPEVPPPESPDFVLISGPSQSSSIQIINGQMSASKTISWQIAPTRTGKLAINPVSVKYRGKTYSTEAVTVTVTTAASGRTQPQAKKPAQSATGQSSRPESVFLKTNVTRSSVYKGEELIVSFDLYYQNNVRQYGRKKMPEAQGFWLEEFPMPAQPRVSNETVNGVAYRKATIQQIALFATTTGELTIDPILIDCEVIQASRRRSVFDDFFDDSFFGDPFGSTKVVTIQSEPLKIHVKPLPENGQPSSFSGAVGQFRMESSIDTLQTQQDQALTLRYKISGNGNINSLKLPPLFLPNSVEVFEPKIKKTIDNSRGTIQGSVTFEYVLIPRRPGVLAVPSLAFSYFDPQTGTYRTLKARGFNVRVGSNENAQSGQIAGLSKTEISLLGQDIRFIMRDMKTWRRTGCTVLNEFWFWLLNGLSLAIAVGAVGLRWWTDKLETNLAFARRRKAWPKAQNKLRALHEMDGEPVTMDFYSQLNQVLTGYIADRLSLPLAGLGPKEIEQTLRAKELEPDLIASVVSLLARLDEIRFLPGLAVSEKPLELLAAVREVLTNLSKVI